MSARQDILDAVDTALSGILTASGYNTNAGQNVFIQRATPLNDTEMPGIMIFDTESVEAITFGEELHILALEMVIAVAATSNADDTARQVQEDIVTVINSDPTFGGLAADTRIERDDEVIISPAEQFYSGSLMRVEIEYTTDLYDS